MELEVETNFDKSLAFPCVQLDIQGKEAICDITIKKERGYLAVLLFDYTQHYAHLHEAAQEKKSALLNEREFQLKAEHEEEKKQYLTFMRKRIDENIVSELDQIAKNLEKLKNITENSEQLSILGDIESSFENFQLKANQIREELDFDFD